MTSCPTRPLPAATLFMILFPKSFDEDPERCNAVAARMEAAYPGLQFKAVQNRFIRPENGFTLSCSEPTLIPCIGAAGEGVDAASQPGRPSLGMMRELEESLRIAVRGAAALDQGECLEPDRVDPPGLPLPRAASSADDAPCDE